MARTWFLFLAAISVVISTTIAVLTGVRLRARQDPGSGFADRGELRRVAGERSARRAARVTRPSLDTEASGSAEVGYPLGRSVQPRGVELVADWEKSLQLVAPPGSGKTLRVLVPILRQHPGPVLATSTKPDLYEMTVGARRHRGPVFTLDPEHLCPAAEPVRWSPVAGCGDTTVAERRAGALVAAAADGSDLRSGAFFRRSAAAVLAALLHAAALEERTMRDVLSWAARPNDAAPLRILAERGSPDHDWAARLHGHTSGAEETTSGVMRTVDLALGCFSEPRVLALTSIAPADSIELRELLTSSSTLYLLGKDRGAIGGSGPLLTAFADELVTTAEQLATTHPARRLDPPLLACLDEAPSIVPLPSLPALVADGRGRGIVVVLAMQSFSQSVERWGATGAATIRNAASILAVFGGLSVSSDLEELSRLCGTRVSARASWSDGDNRAGTSWQNIEEPVLTPAEIRALPEGTALLLWGRLPPVLAYLPGTWEGRDAKEIAAEERRARAANDKARCEKRS